MIVAITYCMWLNIFFALNKFYLIIDRMREKISIFVKSFRNLTEEKKTEKFMDADMRVYGKPTF